MSKVEDILKKVGDKIEDITVLKIQTVMAPLEIAADGKIKLTPAKGVDGMISTLDLIDGDINTTIAPSFYENIRNSFSSISQKKQKAPKSLKPI